MALRAREASFKDPGSLAKLITIHSVCFQHGRVIRYPWDVVYVEL